MKILNSFSRDFDDSKFYIKVGDEYKVVDIEHDPFYGKLCVEYKKQLAFENFNTQTFRRKLIDLQQQITDYFVGEYTETTDQEFQDIWEEFFKHWYWEDVYVCYSEEVLQEEINSWTDRLDINPDYCRSDNPYRLFKLVKRIDQNKAIYSSVYTGLTYEIDSSVIPIVWASANRGMNWLYWRDLIKDFIAGEQSFIMTQKLANKRLIRKTKNESNAQNEDADLRTLKPVFEVNSTDATLKNNYEPFDICSPEIPKGIWDNLLNWFMTRAGWLGFMQNMNDKKERLTTGENFKDLHAVSNVQYRNLKALNEFGRRFGRLYEGKELNFNLSNWGEAQGLPTGEFGSGEDIDNQENNDQANSNTKDNNDSKQ